MNDFIMYFSSFSIFSPISVNIFYFHLLFCSINPFPTHIFHFKVRPTPFSDRRQGRQLTSLTSHLIHPCLCELESLWIGEIDWWGGKRGRITTMGVLDGTSGTSADVPGVGLKMVSVSFWKGRSRWKRRINKKMEAKFNNIGRKSGKNKEKED